MIAGGSAVQAKGEKKWDSWGLLPWTTRAPCHVCKSFDFPCSSQGGKGPAPVPRDQLLSPGASSCPGSLLGGETKAFPLLRGGAAIPAPSCRCPCCSCKGQGQQALFKALESLSDRRDLDPNPYLQF